MVPVLGVCQLYDTFISYTDSAPTEIHTLSLHDALPILARAPFSALSKSFLNRYRISSSLKPFCKLRPMPIVSRSEEHTSELQSRRDLVCRLLLEKKKRDCCRVLRQGCRYGAIDN